MSPRSPFFLFLLLIITVAGLISWSVRSHASDDLSQSIQQIETESGSQIGVAILGSALGTSWQYRADERFALNSTFKSFACAHLLFLSDQDKLALNQTMAISRADLVVWSPVTKIHVGSQMSLSALCEAAVTMSDNTAANKILDAIGGPTALTRFMRSIGDDVTRVDRREPEMNQFREGDPFDTTSPIAAAQSIKELLHGTILSSSSRILLETWMINDQVANSLIRKVLPAGWRIADKSGAGRDKTRGIIAALWPPQGNPIYVAIYLKEGPKALKSRNAIIAKVSERIFQSIAATSPFTR